MLGKLLILVAALSSTSALGEDFYRLTAKTARGQPYLFEGLKGKVVVVANTASKCGFTAQYKELQSLQDDYASRGLVVLGMPSNSFQQEDLDAGKAADFCELNYGVKFVILQKAAVQGPDAHAVFKHLAEKAPETGDVKWNFEKFIVDRTGRVVARFPSAVSPNAAAFRAALESALGPK